MSRRSSFANDLILCPWWVSTVLALISWVVLRGIIPAIQLASPFFRALAPAAATIAPLVAIFFLALSVISAIRSWRNRAVVEKQTGLDSLRSLPWKNFEDLLAEAYRRQGYRVEERLGGGPDGGVDLVLGRDRMVTLVQCKRWRGKPVSVQTVRELFGVLHDRHADGAKLVATTRFTSEATAFAAGKPIELVDQDALLSLIRDVQTSGRMRVPIEPESDHLAPACPQCSAAMILRTARRGRNAGAKFWGCPNYPKCRGTRTL
ncbi:MAG TPA: restriction endonuclease [Chthoniobacterales bacterium]|jgi:restriction system protein